MSKILWGVNQRLSSQVHRPKRWGSKREWSHDMYTACTVCQSCVTNMTHFCAALLCILTQRDWSLFYHSPLEFRLLPLRWRLLESPSVIMPDLSLICVLPLSELSTIIFSLASWSASCTFSVGTLCRPTFLLSSVELVADISANLQSKDYRVCVSWRWVRNDRQLSEEILRCF